MQFITMKSKDQTYEIKFSKEAIQEQIGKIFNYPFFRQSPVLKRFLLFITEETLAGHSNWIKEYTVGVSVLNKPVDFNPRESCIVRIHAARLRRALHKYYLEKGFNDPIYITVPKGGYVPIFGPRVIIDTDQTDYTPPVLSTRISFGIVPFLSLPSNSDLSNAFAHALCDQLYNVIKKDNYYSVAEYHITRNLYERVNSLKNIAAIVAAQYLLCGSIQYLGEKLRVNVQLIMANTGRLVWTEVYNRSMIGEADFFNMQYDVTDFISVSLNAFFAGQKVPSEQLATEVA
jgi:adenylate cyclase